MCYSKKIKKYLRTTQVILLNEIKQDNKKQLNQYNYEYNSDNNVLPGKAILRVCKT